MLHKYIGADRELSTTGMDGDGRTIEPMEVTRAILQQRTIRSPVNGVVVERMLSAGEFVERDPILSIAQIHPLRVEVAVPLDRYGQIKVGMTGRVEWEAAIGEAHAATVTVVDPVVDAASGTLGVRLELPNPAGRLPAGTKCRVSF